MKKVFLENNEDIVLENISRNFKNDFKTNPSVKNDIIEEEVITEGLKFFKVSKRLYKLSEKIARKAKQRNKPELLDLTKKIANLAKNFEEAEDLYEIGNKAEAKERYKKLTKGYAELLKMLKKSEVADGLKSIGGIAMTMASMVVPYLLLNKFFPTLSFGAVQTAAAQKGFMDQAGLFLKRAGAMTLCGIPTRAAKGIFDNGVSSYDDKIVNRVDKLLS